MRYSWLFLGMLLWSACGEKKESINPQIGNISESVYASGIVKSENQYQVFARSNGTLEKIWVNEGDPIQKGQILYTISNEVSTLNANNAKLAAQNNDLKANADKIQELELALNLSKKKMENDRLLYERQQSLWRDEIGSKVELEQRELAYNSSKLNYESNQLRLQELKRQLAFVDRQSKTNLAMSESMLGDYSVKSELNGILYKSFKEVGEMVNPQTPLGIVGDASSFYIELQVDENDIVQVQPNQTVFITMDSYKGQTFEASISRVGALMNERSRTFLVEARFVNNPPRLYPNLTLEASILLRRKEKALTIPRAYLMEGDSVLIEPNKKKFVKVGLKDYNQAEILEGLQATDKIYRP
ncbi:MAG: efflux RND transporter periplasmic adaptor subunit [Chitinophagaceae bacterium]